MNCAYELGGASRSLSIFQAPVLFNYYLNADTYRFLWLRSFHRPVLLTLRQGATGATLRTQFLSKFPLILHLSSPDPDEPGISRKEAARRAAFAKVLAADARWQEQVAESKRPAVLVTAEETTTPILPEQWQHFEALLNKARFEQMAPCQPTYIIDGASWLLESHRSDGYHMVLRHSPSATDAFRAACEYLLDLSSARREERY